MAAPPEQIGAALQRAGQYAGDSTVWTKENAPDVGLDPERGYVAKGTPIYAPPPPAPAQVKPTPANIPQAKAPAKDAEPAYPGAIPVVNPEQEQMQKQAAAFKEQQRLGQPAGSQPGVNQPKQLGEPEKGYEGAIAVDQPKPEAKKDDPNAYPGAIPADEQPKQLQAAQPPQGPQAQQPPQQRPQAQQQPPPGTYPTITSDQGGPGTPAQPPGIQPPAIQPPSAEQAQQPPQTVTPSVPPSVSPSGGQRVKVEGISPLTDDEAKEPKIDIQSNGYYKGRGDQSLRYVILHSTDGKSEQGDIDQLTRSGKVGVQYYVTKDGRIMHFVNDGDSAWHAGKDRFGGYANQYTLGIEQQHIDGKDAWPDLQVRSTAKVVASILKRNPNLTIDDVMGHSDIAGERKQDPVDYPWEHFRNYVRAYLNITSDQISASGKPAGHLAAGPGDQAKQADVLKTLNQAGLNATHFGYKNDPYLDPESGAGHGKYVEHMVKGYDVALNAAAAAKVGNPKPGEEFTFAGQKWRYGDAVPERYSDARFDIFDPDNQFSGGGLFAGAGGGKKGTTAPATAGALGGGPLAGQPMFSIPSAPRRPEAVAEPSQPPSGGGGGGGMSYGGQQEVSQRAGDINLGSFPDAAAIAMMMRRGGGQQPQRTGAAAAPPAEEEQPSALVAALVKRGFTQQQAEAYALGKQTTVPYTARLQPPAAPGVQGPAPLALGPPAAPGGIAGSQADALKTLQALGIKKGQAQAMLQGAKGKTVQELVRSALQAQQQAKGGAVPKTRPVQAQVVTPPPTPQAAVAGRPPTPQERRAQIAAHTEQAIAEKRPMHISYISAPKEAARHPTRESRTIQYEEHSPEARLMGTTTGQLVGHSLIPVESKVTKEGEPYVLGLSTNVMANNHRHINEKLAAMGRKSPYPELDHNFSNGVEGYLANLNAGHTGTGQGYQVGTEEHPIDPDLSHIPHKLTRNQADFVNLVINNTKAFAKANQPLRELARANGTLITEAGETNRMRHDIEQHEPGWRQRVLEPSVRSFKSGLIHEVHPTEESLPETIRPGPEYQHLTKTLHRAIQSGRPDIPISVSLHHNFEHNKLINRIERDFSDGKLNETDARSKLESMGEDPDQYRFIAGSGGLITPYEESPEAITPEEHSQLKDNLRKQWIGGKMPVEDYRRKVAEVPLPEIASRKTTTTSEGTEALAPAPKPPKLEEGPTEEPAPEPPQKKTDLPAKPQDKPEPTETAQLPAAKPQKAQPPAAPGPTVTKGEPATPGYRKAEPEEFIASRNKTTRKGFLSPLSPEDIAKHKLFMSHDGTSGAAVSPEGDIQNVFNNGGPKGAGAHAVAHAIENGGHTLDAFAPYLPHFYRQFGFKETGRMKFNRDHAPKGWDYAKDGEPDVVFMGRGGDPAETTQSALTRAKGDRNQWLEHEHSTNYSDDWESQKQASRAYAQRAGVHPVAGAQREEGTLSPGDQPRPETGQGVGRSLESPPAPGEVPTPTKAKALTKPAPSAAQAPEKPDWETADEPTRQKYLKKRVKQILANQSTDESAIPLKALKNDDGSYKYDPQGNPTFDKPGYNIVNSPFLKKKGLDQLDDADNHEDTIDPEQHGHLNPTERRRLSALRKASAVETMGNKIFESYNSIKDIPEIAAGKGWYSRMRDKLAKALGPDNEIFAQLLGATSAKTPVRSNFIQALDAYEKWKRGDFDRHAQKYLEAHHKMEEGDGALTQHMRNLGILGENDPDHKTEAHAMAHWIEHHDILPKQQTGAKYNANSNAVLKVLAGTWLKEADAPKTPNFAGNLTGRTKEATIDVWAARHIKRLGHEGLTGGKPWRDQAKGESGVSGLDFAYSQDAMRHAADKIGINPDDLQAILWYAEKHHYQKQGWTRGEGAKKASFDDVFDKVFHKSGEPMNSQELRSHYAEEAKAAQQLKDKITLARQYHQSTDPKTQAKLEPYLQKHAKIGLTREHLTAAPEQEEEEEAA